MPSDSVSSFLSLVRANRLFETDEFERIFGRPDAPQQNVRDLCDYLQSRGVLTRFQTDLIRAGHMTDLTFAGYPVLDERGPVPGGTEYAALHPSLRTPVVLRRYRSEWFGPADNAAAFVRRAKAASPLVHPHLATLLDAGVHQDDVFVAIEEFKGGDLQTLVADIGPMPGQLAAEYGRQIALGVRAAHEKGLVHGHVRPGCAFAGPLTPMSRPRPDGSPRYRPSATAVVKLFDLGVTPLRPPLAAWASDPACSLDSLAYFAPERVDASEPTAAGDVYGLGATLYFLLTGRAPFFGTTHAEILDAVRTMPPSPLQLLRPDLPAELVGLVNSMTAKMPMARPSAATVVEQLAKFGIHPPTQAPAAAGTPPLLEMNAVAVESQPVVPMAVAVDAPAADHRDIPLASEVADGTEAGVTPLQTAADDLAPLTPAPPGDDPIPSATPVREGTWVPTPYTGPADASQVPYAQPEGGEWGNTDFVQQTEYDPTVHAEDPHLMTHDDSPPRPRRPADRGNLYLWLGLGLLLQLLAVLGWVYLMVIRK